MSMSEEARERNGFVIEVRMGYKGNRWTVAGDVAA